MTQAAQVHAPVRDPLHKSVLLVFVYSTLFSHLYDAIWLSNFFRRNYKNKISFRPPIWPIYIGAISYLLYFSTILFEISTSLFSIDPLVTGEVLATHHQYTFLTTQIIALPLRIYKAYLINQFFLTKCLKWSYIGNLILTILFPIPFGQYRLNKELAS